MTARCGANYRTACFRKAALSAYAGVDELTRHTKDFQGESQNTFKCPSLLIQPVLWFLPSRKEMGFLQGKAQSTLAAANLQQTHVPHTPHAANDKHEKSHGIPPLSLHSVLFRHWHARDNTWIWINLKKKNLKVTEDMFSFCSKYHIRYEQEFSNVSHFAEA